MTRRVWLAGMAGVSGLGSQTAPDIPFVCPMDPDVRAGAPAKCPKCGMTLVAGIPDAREFHVDLQLKPAVPRAGMPVRMRFEVRDPDTGKLANLQIIHEKLFHLFLVSQDLSFFAHEHPVRQADGSFAFDSPLPLSGQYRLLCDFYPEKGTPQMIPRTVIVPGEARSPSLRSDLGTQQGQNLKVELRCDPPEPLAGKKTMLFFRLDPVEGLERYLGAWGHMLVASSDLIDTIHTHPAWEQPGPAIQFNMIFPRVGIHRIWVQFQREGVVNTVAFNVPVAAV